jgi:hypothetical protein
MAESAGRYCQLCGEPAGLMDRSCRRCGESLLVPGEGRVPDEDANVPSGRRGRSWLRRGFSVGFGVVGIVIAIMVLGVACAVIGVVVGD